MLTKQDLINFETDIFDNYSEGKIRAPVHLTGSVNGKQEDELIKIFKRVKKNDWVFSTHRSHYHSLLKSQDMEWVKSEIFAKRSSHINSEKHKIFTSAIVGGILPIALGTALAIKKKRKNGHVWCFIGDMAAEMGIFMECYKYAFYNKLPITFVIENNTWGVYTPTREAWGSKNDFDWKNLEDEYIITYNYKRKYPHYGIGKWVTF